MIDLDAYEMPEQRPWEAPWRDRRSVAHIAEVWRSSTQEMAWRNWIARLVAPDLGVAEQILEVGCGGGLLYGALSDVLGDRLRYIGIDNSDLMLEAARDHFPKAAFESGDGFRLRYPDRSFGTVMAISVLGHLPDFRPMLRELCRVARHRVFASFWLVNPERPGPDGRLFTQPSYYVRTQEAVEGAIVALPGGPWRLKWHDKPGFEHSVAVINRPPGEATGEMVACKPSTVRILTLSNKPDLLVEAKASVARQTRQAGLTHVIAIDDGTHDWAGRYPPNVWINEMAENADSEDYLLFLSDDDLLLPNAVEDLAGYLDAHPDVMACYGGGTMNVYDPPKKDRRFAHVPAEQDYDGKQSLAGRVGSGMTMWRTKAWREVGPLPEYADGQTSLSDGIWFTALARRFGLYAIHKDVIYTRVTARSAHTAPNGRGGWKEVDWRRLHPQPAKVTAGRYDSRQARARAKGTP